MAEHGKKWGNDGKPIPVSREIFEGIEAVRQSGRVNMLDRPMVAHLAFESDFFAAAIWIEEHKDEYSRALFNGFRIV